MQTTHSQSVAGGPPGRPTPGVPSTWRADEIAPANANALRAIVGNAYVLTSVADRYIYSRDRLPYGLFKLRMGELPGTLPSAIVIPGSQAELIAIVKFANRERLRLIPFGAGSGVLGGVIALSCEVMVDLKRMNRLLELNETDGTVTVEAGMNGGHFEEELNARGFTANHLPQSIFMSTVGGWAACRGAGQASSRYGKIEDIVVGLKAILPDGRPLVVRPVARRAVGPSIKDLIIGSEGVFGFITELTLRIGRQAQVRRGITLAFPTLQSAMDAMRGIVQGEGRPSVMRLYDLEESTQRTQGLSSFVELPILVILQFSGPALLAAAEEEFAMQICELHGGCIAENRPYEHCRKQTLRALGRNPLPVLFRQMANSWVLHGHDRDHRSLERITPHVRAHAGGRTLAASRCLLRRSLVAYLSGGCLPIYDSAITTNARRRGAGASPQGLERGSRNLS